MIQVKRRQIKSSCGCGNRGYVFEISEPISKKALPAFKQAGFTSSDQYARVGVFFVEKNGMTASGPFGGSKFQVRCGGSANCSQMLDHLENTFKIALAQK